MSEIWARDLIFAAAEKENIYRKTRPANWKISFACRINVNVPEENSSYGSAMMHFKFSRT
jgi:hypothetical protein